MSTCRITGTLINAHEEPLVGVKVYAVPAVSETVVPNKKGISLTPVFAATDETGNFTIDLIRKIQFVIIIRELGIQEPLCVPDEECAELWPLLGMQQTGTDTNDDDNW